MSGTWRVRAGLVVSRLSRTQAPSLLLYSVMLIVWLPSLRSPSWIRIAAGAPAITATFQAARRMDLQVKSAPFKDFIPEVTYNMNRTFH